MYAQCIHSKNVYIMYALQKNHAEKCMYIAVILENVCILYATRIKNVYTLHTSEKMYTYCLQKMYTHCIHQQKEDENEL